VALAARNDLLSNTELVEVADPIGIVVERRAKCHHRGTAVDVDRATPVLPGQRRNRRRVPATRVQMSVWARSVCPSGGHGPGLLGPVQGLKVTVVVEATGRHVNGSRILTPFRMPMAK
jgi:hypothetical protein